jgi:uncharacterized protein YoxC
MLLSVQIAFLAVVALLVGIIIPLVFSLRSLAKRAEQSLGHFDESVSQALEQTNNVLARADKVGAEVEKSIPKLAQTVNRIEEFSRSLDNLRKHVRTASMIGAAAAPAVISAIQTLRAAGGTGGRGSDQPGCTGERATESRGEASGAKAGNPDGKKKKSGEHTGDAADVHAKAADKAEKEAMR